MKLVYKDTGKEVEAGDIGTFGNTDEEYEVIYFAKPHSPNSSGKVTVRQPDADFDDEFFVGVIGAEWIEREDR